MVLIGLVQVVLLDRSIDQIDGSRVFFVAGGGCRLQEVEERERVTLICLP
jgi:hypothetical protein